MATEYSGTAVGERPWLCYPRGKALGTDLDRNIVMTAARRAGLRGVALVAIDQVWSALRVKPAA